MSSALPIYISCFSVLLPIFFWLRKQPHFKSRLLNIIGTLLIASALSDLISFVFAKKGIPNFPVNNLFFVIQFLLISSVYRILIPAHKRTLIWLGSAFGLFFLICSVWFQPILQYQSWTRTVGAVLIISYGIAYFIAIIKDPPEENIFGYGPVWVNIAFMSYFIFSLVVFVMANYIFTHLPPAEIRMLWSTHNFNNILKNIILAFGIYRIQRYVRAKYTYFKKFELDESWWESPL